MKRIYLNLHLLLPIFLVSILATSCNSDSDDLSGSALISNLMENKWVLHETDLNVYGNDELELRSNSHCLYFSSNTEGFEVTITKILDTEGTDTWDRDFSHFTYEVNGNRVTLKYQKSGSMALTYSDGKLSYGSLVYYPASLNSSDRAVIDESKYSGNYDFDYYIDFDDVTPYYYSGSYRFSIPLYFGVMENMKKRGITEFGVAVYCKNGTIENTVNKFTDDAYVYLKRVNGESAKCFSGTINDNNQHSWQTKVSVSSKNKNITLFYTYFFSTKDGSFITGDEIQHRMFGEDGNDDVSKSMCPDNRHPHMIDLGLPSGTLWACCNVGANKPEDYGGYFAWGETTEKSVYNLDTYKYARSYYDYIDIGSNISATSYDVATTKWGAPWRMPTRQQLEELFSYASIKRVSHNGIEGFMFTGLNDGSIFLPAAGGRRDDRINYKGKNGYFWSSSLSEAYFNDAWGLYVCLDDAGARVGVLQYVRVCGHSVRPVR